MLRLGYLSLKSPIAIKRKTSDPPPAHLGLMMVDVSEDLRALPDSLESWKKANPTLPLGISLRSASNDKILQAGEIALNGGHLLELNLCGTRPQTSALKAYIRQSKDLGITLSFRLLPDDLREDGPQALEEAGLDLLHLDMSALDSRAPKIIRALRDSGAPPIMAGVRVGDFEGAKKLFSSGAILLCLEGVEIDFVDWLSQTMREYQAIVGWYNAPKHICAGGDLRGLAFCCPPVKNCPVQGALKRLGLSPEEFIKRKLELGRGTPLEHGEGTCFGSLVWCCKISKPCFLRDAVLRRIKLSPGEYMRLKKEMAEGLLS